MSAYSFLAGCYDDLTYDVDYAAWADYYEAVFARMGLEVKTVLDLACGTGSLSCELASRGYELIGVDSSEDMLAAAQEKAFMAECAVQPMFLNQDMTELDLYGTVDAVVCCLDGINYLPAELLPEVLHRVWLFTEPGGAFIFDINSPFKLRNMDGEVFLDETEDIYCVWRAEYDPEENACLIGMDIFNRSGALWRLEKEEHTEYIHEPQMLASLLEKAGFVDIGVYGELSFDKPAEDEQRIFFVARKPRDR